MRKYQCNLFLIHNHLSVIFVPAMLKVTPLACILPNVRSVTHVFVRCVSLQTIFLSRISFWRIIFQGIHRQSLAYYFLNLLFWKGLVCLLKLKGKLKSIFKRISFYCIWLSMEMDTLQLFTKSIRRLLLQPFQQSNKYQSKNI